MNIERDTRREARHAVPTGFSLLELLIVLAVIAGLMAIAWPNLRKPLGDTPLSQAAASLRELFDECRYQAILRGELTMLRFENQSSTVVMGSWEALLASQLELPAPIADVPIADVPIADVPVDSEQTSNNALIGKRRAPFQYQFALPPDIVIEQVIWSITLPSQSTNNAIDGNSLAAEDSVSGQTSTDLLTNGLSTNGLGDTSDSQSPGFWYVPFTPAGVSKDVSIVLRDNTTQKRIALQHQQGTGLITQTKLPDAVSSNGDSLLMQER